MKTSEVTTLTRYSPTGRLLSPVQSRSRSAADLRRSRAPQDKAPGPILPGHMAMQAARFRRPSGATSRPALWHLPLPSSPSPARPGLAASQHRTGPLTPGLKARRSGPGRVARLPAASTCSLLPARPTRQAPPASAYSRKRCPSPGKRRPTPRGTPSGRTRRRLAPFRRRGGPGPGLAPLAPPVCAALLGCRPGRRWRGAGCVGRALPAEGRGWRR